ncbi:hypothetical protein E3O55_04145 [Cryobacterium sp. MDB1-18-2]|uniref:hypothetical protein n=1 Tax=unclassified Cryobacterium TaxID=2649013 RepID=UPI00106A226A|nr:MULTISPECIES: hypothetical protein [unclassified Cryobacterium]TFC33156.1 hypothetical protein E3O55_04145 [Cryobacterium sp. MDB1-18-2]TFC37011.1 hypothetical protein E3O50_18515 [Cryobacterium sp. MDB1-18-1]
MAAATAAGIHRQLRRHQGWPCRTSLSGILRDLEDVFEPEDPLFVHPVNGESVRELDELVGFVGATNIPLMTLFEALAAIDWRDKSLSQREYGRRASGAWFTPPALARQVVVRAANQYLVSTLGVLPKEGDPTRLGELSKARVADLSVGGGVFASEWIAMIEREVLYSGERGGEHLLRAINGLELTDVNPLALAVSRAMILCRVPAHEAHLVSPVVRWGNSLLERSDALQEPRGRKLDLFIKGLVWDEAFSVPDGSPLDIVVGNPPWERLRLEQRAFFAGLAPEIAGQQRAAQRALAMDSLEATHPSLMALYEEHKKSIAVASRLIRADQRFAKSATGELYTHALFTELAESRVLRLGTVALLVKSSLVTTPGHSKLYQDMIASRRLKQYWEFTNTRRIFPIDGRERFGLLITAAGAGLPRVAADLTQAGDLAEDWRLLEVTDKVRMQLNPITGALPVLAADDMARVEFVSGRNPSFDDTYPEARFGRLLHLTNHSESIHRDEGVGRLGVWEGRMIEQYSARFSTWSGVAGETRWSAKTRANLVSTTDELSPDFEVEPRWWADVSEWKRVSASYSEPFSVAWRNATSRSNRRTMLATLLPTIPTIQSIQIVQFPDDLKLLPLVLAVFNSITFDWLLRLKIPGIDVTPTVVKQMNVPDRDRWRVEVIFSGELGSAAAHVTRRVQSLYRQDARFDSLFSTLGFESGGGVLPSVERRRVLRELDVLVAWAYGFRPEDLAGFARSLPNDIPEEEIETLIHGGFGRVEELPSLAMGKSVANI